MIILFMLCRIFLVTLSKIPPSGVKFFFCNRWHEPIHIDSMPIEIHKNI